MGTVQTYGKANRDQAASASGAAVRTVEACGLFIKTETDQGSVVSTK